MKIFPRICFAVMFGIYSLSAWGQGRKLVGVIDDTYDVNQTGGYNHVVPLTVPPGINGLVPSLSIVYDSRAGLSEMGYGWSISGLSKIVRSGNNFAQNGFLDGVDFTEKDVFLLDGQYLSCIEMNNGSANSIYRTENEGFAFIRAVGAIANSSSSPSYFVVKQPNGLIYYYGENSGARNEVSINASRTEVLEWNLTRIVDRFGNFILFEYSARPDHRIRIESISYAGNGKIGLEAKNKILFKYTSDPVRKTNVGYLAGATFKQNDILSSIQMETNGRSHKYYQFGYDLATAKQLISIRESADKDGISSIPKTTIGWYEQQGIAYTAVDSVDLPAPITNYNFIRDLNGDQKDEYISLTKVKIAGKDSLTLNVFTREDGKYVPVIINLPVASGYTLANGVDFLDLNGDQLIDIVTPEYVLINNSRTDRISFTKQKSGLPVYGVFERTVVDMDGDGRQELFCKSYINSFSIYGLNAKNELVQSGSMSFGNPVVNTRQFLGDFTGSGKTQVLISLIADGQMKGGILKFKDGQVDTKEFLFPAGLTALDWPLMSFVDVNGDGLSDLILPSANPYSTDMRIFLFTGSGFLPTVINKPLSNTAGAKSSFGNYTSSEGLQYLLAWPDNKSEVYDISVPDPNNLSFVLSKTQLKLPQGINIFTSWESLSFEDVDWNGSPDLVFRGKREVKYTSGLGHDNKLREVTDGLKNRVRVTYTGLNDHKTYNCDFGTSLKGSYYFYRGGFPVVKFLATTSASDKFENFTEYSYEGLIAERRGRGIAGFSKVKQYNSTTKILTSSDYRYDFPLTGKLSRQEKSIDGKAFFIQENKWDFLLYHKGNDYQDISLPQASKNLISAALGKSFGNKFSQGDSKAISLMSGFSQKMDTSVLKADSAHNSSQQDIAMSVLHAVRDFSSSGLSYKPLLMSTRIVKYETDGTESSNTLIRNSYDGYANNIKSETVLSEGTVVCVDRKFRNFNADLSLGALYLFGVPLSDSTYVYHPAKNLKTPGRTFHYIYNTNGTIASIIRQRSDARYRHFTDLSYDQAGNITAKKSYNNPGRTLSERYLYTDDKRFIESYINPMGFKTSYIRNVDNGRMVTETDPNGFIMDYQYDLAGNLIREVYPDGKVMDYSYQLNSNGDDGEFTAYTVSEKQPGADLVKRYIDRNGREIASLFPSIGLQGNDKGLIRKSVLTRHYSERRRTLEVSRPAFVDFKIGTNGNLEFNEEGPDPDEPGRTEYGYDAFGRLISIKNPDGKISSVAYKGLTKLETNTGGQVKKTRYDTKGQVTQVNDFSGSTVDYQYDLWGNMILLKTSNGSIEIGYDVLGRKTSVKDPNIGVINYSYDEFDRLIKETTNGVREVRIEYDAIGRVTKKQTPGGNVQWFYDRAVKGKVDSIAQSAGNFTAYRYDRLGRPVAQHQGVNGKLFISNFAYDSLSRVSSKRYPSGLLVSYGYQNNVPTLLSSQFGQDTVKKIWELEEVTASGLVLSGSFGNGLKTENRYGQETELLTMSRTFEPSGSARSLQELRYEYDDLYRINSKADGISGKVENYSYDVLSRLSAVSTDGARMEVGYSNNGNIIEKTGTGIYQYDSQSNQRLRYVYNNGEKVREYSYDGFGNMVEDRKKGIKIGYSYFNKPEMIEMGGQRLEMTYGYNQNETSSTLTKAGKLISRNIRPSSDFEVIEEGNKVTQVHYLSSGGQMTAVEQIVDSAGKREVSIVYLHLDHQGSITAMSNQNGKIGTVYSYSAFGQRLVQTFRQYNRYGQPISGSPEVEELGYTGHRHLDDFGLINAGGRYYDPEVGRFLSPDLFIEDPSSPQSFNRYSYVMNDPINRWDPEGFWSIRKPLNFSKESRAVGRVINNIGRETGNGIRAIGQFHQNVYNEGDRFFDKYGKQVVIIAAAAAITYFTCGAGTAAFWAAVGKGALIGAGVSGGMTAVQGGSFKEVMNASMNGAINGAASAAMFNAIGSSFAKFGEMGLDKDVSFAAKTLVHGGAGGINSELSGGTFKQGFLETSIVHALGPLNESIFDQRDQKFSRIAFSGGVGAIAAYSSGGNVVAGATSGSFSRWFNCESTLPPPGNPISKFMEPGYVAWKCDQQVINDPYFRAGHIDFERSWDRGSDVRDFVFTFYELIRRNSSQKQQPVQEVKAPKHY
ncbi:RHS repeat-associated core domain-containing protein [Pedobacter sp. R-06]|uniref:RHS repeat-associated core domain-containing protein n=1 Tax=Pedobacter sp. R-06 TaxID=3404051 RepID=UPI003CF71F8A